jgi:hypothetical protein
MSISFDSYEDLQASIAAYLQRNNLTAQIPVFIALAEVKLRRTLTTIQAQMGTPWIIQPALGANKVDLPTDLASIAKVKYGHKYLEYVSPEFITDRPQHHWRYEYTTLGDKLYLETYVDGNKLLFIEYFKTIPSLSDAVPSNWLLEDHPDVYLYGTLVEASLYLMDDERLPGWSQALEEAVQEIKEADKVARYPSRSKLIMKVR